jgi:hypothetical protein
MEMPVSIYGTDFLDSDNDGWLKRRAREYCLTGKVSLTTDPEPPKRGKRER